MKKSNPLQKNIQQKQNKSYKHNIKYQIEPDPTNPLLIVCGDFNGGSECGAVQYLEVGEVGPTFIEDGEPVSSKVKKSPLSHPMVDVAESVGRYVSR